MEADYGCLLKNSLIRSFAHFKPFNLNASFKAIIDLNFEGLPKEYSNFSMTRLPDSQCLIHAFNNDSDNYDAYSVDFDTLKTTRLELDMCDVINCLIEGEYMLVMAYFEPMIILRDMEYIGQIEFDEKHKCCKNGYLISGRYIQQVDKTIYAVDYHGCLYRIEWQDIKDCLYRKKLVRSKVENFYVDRELCLTTVNVDGTLSLESGVEVDLRQRIDSQTKFTIVTYIAKYWIISADIDCDGKAIIASISKQGKIKSTLKLKLTCNGYNNECMGLKFGGIFSLHQAYFRGMRGIILATERDGCCHLISVAYGRMSKLQSIDSIVPVDVVECVDKRDFVVLSVAATGTKGEFIAGGFGWNRRITIKLI